MHSIDLSKLEAINEDKVLVFKFSADETWSYEVQGSSYSEKTVP